MKKAIKLTQYCRKCRHNQELCRLIIDLYHSAFKFNPFLYAAFLRISRFKTLGLTNSRRVRSCFMVFVWSVFELLEGTFDVVSLFDLNAEHVLLNWATKIGNNSETRSSLSNSRLMTSF